MARLRLVDAALVAGGLAAVGGPLIAVEWKASAVVEQLREMNGRLERVERELQTVELDHAQRLSRLEGKF